MTRKDFELIAGAFRAARADILEKEPESDHRNLQDGVSYAAEHLADALAELNPNFDRARFLARSENMFWYRS